MRICSLSAFDWHPLQKYEAVLRSTGTVVVFVACSLLLTNPDKSSEKLLAVAWLVRVPETVNILAYYPLYVHDYLMIGWCSASQVSTSTAVV